MVLEGQELGRNTHPPNQVLGSQTRYKHLNIFLDLRPNGILRGPNSCSATPKTPVSTQVLALYDHSTTSGRPPTYDTHTLAGPAYLDRTRLFGILFHRLKNKVTAWNRGYEVELDANQDDDAPKDDEHRGHFPLAHARCVTGATGRTMRVRQPRIVPQ